MAVRRREPLLAAGRTARLGPDQVHPARTPALERRAGVGYRDGRLHAPPQRGRPELRAAPLVDQRAPGRVSIASFRATTTPRRCWSPTTSATSHCASSMRAASGRTAGTPRSWSTRASCRSRSRSRWRSPRPRIGPDDDSELDTEPIHYARAVELPLRPIDLETLLNPEDEEGEVAAERRRRGRSEWQDGRRSASTSRRSRSGVAGLSDTDVADARRRGRRTRRPRPSHPTPPRSRRCLRAVNPDCL